MLANIQWIGRQPLVSAIESSIESPSEFASGDHCSEATHSGCLANVGYDSTAVGICQRRHCRDGSP